MTFPRWDMAIFIDILLVTEGLHALQGRMRVLTRDHLFASPGMAAMALTERSANGWVEWKAVNRRTLTALKRQAVQVAGFF